LTESEYADWLLGYTVEHTPDFLSPFSANASTLTYDAIADNSQMSDQVTMWEMDMLKALKKKNVWLGLSNLSKPSIIGPDRASAEHSRNVLDSFSGSVTYIRPEYEKLVDVIGTQARYADQSANETNFNALSGDGLTAAWCTMCSQEWYRQIDSSLGYTDLRSSRA